MFDKKLWARLLNDNFLPAFVFLKFSKVDINLISILAQNGQNLAAMAIGLLRCKLWKFLLN